VFQLETAMGAAIESFENAGAILVPRARFAPVKTTSDLFVLRSDVYRITPDFKIELVNPDAPVPLVTLDDKYYKLVDQMDALVQRAPSLLRCKELIVVGPVKFAAENDAVVLVGSVKITVSGTEPKVIGNGVWEGEIVL
jgi:UTP--glucose-1-phosphate uridylyltransferase/phosphoglucomutase